MRSLRFCFFEGTTRSDLQEGLGYLSRFLQERPCPKQAIENFRADYQEDMEEDQEEGINLWGMSRETLSLFYGIDPNYPAFVFSQDDHFIRTLCQAFFEPSRMALIVTGDFDSSEAEGQLKSLFEDISGDGLFLSTAKPKNDFPVVATIKAPEITELLFSEEGDRFLASAREENPHEASLCMYQLAPSFKQYALNDLFVLIYLGPEHFISFSTDNLQGGDCEIPFAGKPMVPKIDERIFHQAKTELAGIYRYRAVDKMEQCTNHFLSEIAEPLEPKNQNLLRELDLVTQQDLEDFMDQKISSAITIYEFNQE